jgi:hydroxylaminobenzene mutase
MNSSVSRKLKRLGMLLFLIGLITGFIVMEVTNPRMGLAAHLEGVMNGTFLVVAGLVWNDLRLPDGLKRTAFFTLTYGTFANWTFTLTAAILGTSQTTPLSGAGYQGSESQELLVTIGLVSVGLTMVIALGIIVYGLRGNE